MINQAKDKTILNISPLPTLVFSEKLYTYNADEMARQRSQARVEYLAHERAVNNRLAKLSEENAVLVSENQAIVSENQAMAAEIERLHARLAALENPEVSK